MKPEEAVRKFESKYPGREVKEIRVLKDGFFITAPQKASEDIDYSDPFFVMDSAGNKIVGFVPSENFELFNKIMGSSKPAK
jgi:hypothetical protein